MIARLPAELVDIVLELLYYDEGLAIERRNGALFALCLASRGMQERAAPLLYSTVVLPSPQRVQTFFSQDAARGMRTHLRFLWCGIVNEVLYGKPHPLLASGKAISAFVKEVGWMQADSTGRYYGFHYSTAVEGASGSEGIATNGDVSSARSTSLHALHIVCPDLGRWAMSVFECLPDLRRATMTLYPR